MVLPGCLGGAKVTFTPEFPMQAPEFVFLRPSPVHPHIYSNGTSALSVSQIPLTCTS
jgi:hypothetical protein